MRRKPHLGGKGYADKDVQLPIKFISATGGISAKDGKRAASREGA